MVLCLQNLVDAIFVTNVPKFKNKPSGVINKLHSIIIQRGYNVN